MDILIKIAQFILSFSLLVFVHELGHFLFARMFGIRVDKFYIFFDPWFSLVKFKIGHTEYGIGWIPFGGYCKISGMIDESMDTEQLAQPVQPWEFRSKPAWQRLLVMVGGVLMNLILAICVYVGMSNKYGDEYIANDDLKYGYAFNDLGREMGFRNGDRIISVNGKHYDDYRKVFVKILIKKSPEVEVLRGTERLTIKVPKEFVARKLEAQDLMTPRIPFVVAETIEGGGAAAARLQPGDSLVAMNDVPLMYFDEYKKAIGEHKGDTIRLTVSRQYPGAEMVKTVRVAVSDDGTIGVYPKPITSYVPVTEIGYNFCQAIPAGFKRTGTEIADYWDQLKLIFTPGSKAFKSIGGPLAIGNIFPKQWDWFNFWRITAFLSIVLAVMNILPVPALDGGHVMFLLFEVVTGRKPGDKFLERAQLIGLVLLFSLIIYATGNDIYRIFIK